MPPPAAATPRVFAIVPAAGQGRRMGADKLLLHVAGRPLLLAVLEPLATADIAGLIVVTRRSLAERLDLAAWISAPAGGRCSQTRVGGPCSPSSLVFNDDPASEMIDSIRIGLSALTAQGPRSSTSRTGSRSSASRRPSPDDGFLVCPADQPGIATADFNLCIAVFRADPARIVVATHGGRRGHPLIFPAELADFVRSTACDGGLRALREHYAERVVLLECASPGVVRDIDTPDEYAQLA